jgi:hypothetical protein
MTVDCRKYQTTLSKSRTLIDVLIARHGGDKSTASTYFSISSGIPLVVVYLYMLKTYGSDEDLTKKIEQLCHFYRYGTVLDFDGNNMLS